MKHWRFSFLTWRMEPQLKYCSDLIDERTEHLGHEAKMSEYLRPFKGRRFPGRTPPASAGPGAASGGTRSVGPAHAPSLSAGPPGCGSFCVPPSTSYSEGDGHLSFSIWPVENGDALYYSFSLKTTQPWMFSSAWLPRIGLTLPSFPYIWVFHWPMRCKWKWSAWIPGCVLKGRGLVLWGSYSSPTSWDADMLWALSGSTDEDTTSVHRATRQKEPGPWHLSRIELPCDLRLLREIKRKHVLVLGMLVGFSHGSWDIVTFRKLLLPWSWPPEPESL